MVGAPRQEMMWPAGISCDISFFFLTPILLVCFASPVLLVCFASPGVRVRACSVCVRAHGVCA